MRNRIIIALLVAIGVSVFWAFWRLPYGEGEYRDSPDGVWRAHVSALSQGTLLGSRRRYVELRIQRLTDGTTEWQQELPHAKGDSVPAYGDRNARFITWAPDSKQFTVITTNGATLSLPISVATKAQSNGAATGSSR